MSYFIYMFAWSTEKSLKLKNLLDQNQSILLIDPILKNNKCKILYLQNKSGDHGCYILLWASII